MKKSNTAMLAATLLLTIATAGAAEAAGRGGAGGPSTGGAPAGFGSGGNRTGFETFTNTTTIPGTATTPSQTVTTTERLPPGWDQGKADWKAPLQGSNPSLTTLPPGLSRH